MAHIKSEITDRPSFNSSQKQHSIKQITAKSNLTVGFAENLVTNSNPLNLKIENSRANPRKRVVMRTIEERLQAKKEELELSQRKRAKIIKKRTDDNQSAFDALFGGPSIKIDT